MATGYIRRTIQLAAAGGFLVLAGIATAIIGRTVARRGDPNDLFQPELVGIEWVLAGAATITIGLGFFIGAWVAFLMSRPEPPPRPKSQHE